MKKNFKKGAVAQGILTKKVTSNDGVNALITSLGINGFVKTAVENAYFCRPAFDPRFSTNVTVPAWAKSLMDKKNSLAGSVASILQSTIKAICSSAVPCNGNDILHGIYTINVIDQNSPINKVAAIKQIQVTV